MTMTRGFAETVKLRDGKPTLCLKCYEEYTLENGTETANELVKSSWRTENVALKECGFHAFSKEGSRMDYKDIENLLMKNGYTEFAARQHAGIDKLKTASNRYAGW